MMNNEIDNDIKSLLDKVGKQNVFSVPENYFENFEVNIPNKIIEKKRIFSIQHKPMLAIAATILICCFVIYIFQHFKTQFNTLGENEVKLELSKLDKNDIENYLIENIDEVNDESLVINTNTNNINMYIIDIKTNDAEYKDLFNNLTESEINDLNI